MGVLNRCFYCPERLVCYIKRRKSFFHDLFSRSITSEYKGLQGVTGGYKGLQGVTGVRRGDRGYKGLKGVTRGDRGLKRILQTFFLTRTIPNTISWSILHKIQS